MSGKDASQEGRYGNGSETSGRDCSRGGTSETCDRGRPEAQGAYFYGILVSVLLLIDSDCPKGALSAARTRYGYTRTFSRGWLRVVARPVQAPE